MTMKNGYLKNRLSERWDEGFPLGNGKLGGLIFGNEKLIKLNIDCSLLWDTRYNKEITAEDFKFSEFIRLVGDGKNANEQLQQKFGNFFEAAPYPTKLPVGHFKFTSSFNFSGICELDYKRAIAKIGLDNSDNLIEVYFDAVEFVGIIKYPKAIKADFVLPNFSDKEENGLGRLGYGCADKQIISNGEVYLQHTYGDRNYSVVILKKEFAEYREIVFDVIVDCNDEKLYSCIQKLNRVLSKGYEEVVREHINWWQEYWKGASVSLPDKEINDLYDFAHYLFGSGSRTGFPPMPLQGVWSAADGKLPPWKGDYHLDLNFQFTYNWAFRAGRQDGLGAAIDYFIERKEFFEKFAERFFDDRNVFFIPGTASLAGDVMGGWVQYTYSLGSFLWMLLLLAKWADYFETARFVDDFLIPVFDKTYNLIITKFLVKNGNRYDLLISSSPEINNAEYEAWVKNSVYDVSFLKAFLTKYIGLLSMKERNIDKVVKVLNGLPEESIDDSGYMLAENMPLTESHRHFSHCVNIYPIQTLDYLREKDKVLMDKCIDTLEKYGSSMWIGFSFTWMALLCATAGEGEKALRYLRIFIDAFISSNGFHLNGDYKKLGYSSFDYRPFTIEANFMFADAVQEMLMQCHHGKLRLFPSIPKSWLDKGCSFSGFRLDKEIVVDAKYDSGEIFLNIYCESVFRRLRVVADGKEYSIECHKGRSSWRLFDGHVKENLG